MKNTAIEHVKYVKSFSNFHDLYYKTKQNKMEYNMVMVCNPKRVL